MKLALKLIIICSSLALGIAIFSVIYGYWREMIMSAVLCCIGVGVIVAVLKTGIHKK